MAMSATRPFHAFNRDEKGNTAILFGLMIIPIVGLVGAAIDFGHAYRLQGMLQYSADAAALAAINAKGKSSAERITLAQATFKSNYNPSNPSAAPTPNVTVDGTSVTVTASETMATTALGVLGVNSTTVSATSSAATTTGKKAEVAMMVDLTGSMGATRGGMTKIAALKLAGEDILNILMPDGDSSDVRVAIAPMADYVNAGSYAANVTGLASTGVYNNQYNLASTKQGPFSGAYTGSYSGSTSGNQHGATSAASAQAGATFDNQYCATPTTTTNQINYIRHTGRINYTNYDWPVAASYSSWSYAGASWGYFWVENYGGISGNWAWGRMYYTQKTTTTSTTSVVPGCEGQNANTGPLVTCVTERTDSTNRYTDASPTSGGYVGPYNQSATGTTNKLNYSSDGKCWVSGRELPSIIPLTGTKSTLSAFFSGPSGTGPQIGGGTPGHLGHAWAWYMLSPNWSSVFGSSAGVSYSDSGTKKYAIIMTDGEYNEQYSSVASRTQALELCTGMKNAGIKVFTVGFGFDPNVAAGASNADGQAKSMLQSCASDTSSYYFPYDGTALRAAFQSIGNAVMNGPAADNTTLTQ